MSLNIKTKNIVFDFIYHGIKIFQTDYCSKLVKEILDNSIITINNKNIKNESVIVIDELTKTNSFINLAKNSKLNEKIFKIIDNNQIINLEMVEKIKMEINKSFEVITNDHGDFNKLINLLFSVLDLGYIEEKTLIYLLDEILFDKNYLIIFNDVSWLKLSTLLPYLNKYNFIIVTNDFRKIIRNKRDLSLLAIFKDQKYFEVEDEDKLIAYIEKNTNISLTNNINFETIINDQYSENSILIFNLLKKMA